MNYANDFESDRFGVHSFFNRFNQLGKITKPIRQVKNRIYVLVNVRSSDLAVLYLDNVKNRKDVFITIEDTPILCSPFDAITYASQKGYDYECGDTCWVVLDGEGLSKENIDDIFDKAKENNIKIAFSNPSFDLWFLLHFDWISPMETNINRNKILQELYGFCGSNDLQKLLAKITNKQRVKNAKEHNDILWAKQKDPTKIPYTDVHLLIDSISIY
jgi:hypothetical protein